MISNVVLYVIWVLSARLVVGACPEFSGSFFVEQQDLYPESADFDPKTCKLYLRHALS